MSIEVKIVENRLSATGAFMSADWFGSEVESCLNEGFELLSFKVVPRDGEVLYSALLKRDSIGERTSLSSMQEMLETLERRQKDIVRRLKVIETTLDDDTSADERAYSLVREIDHPTLIPLSRIEIIDREIEDDLRNGR